MSKFNHFASENVGLSILGHMVLLCALVFVADVIIGERERFVAPDRIQIMMIDLSQVKVSGEESVLYNTNVPDKDETKEEKTVEPEPKPEQNADVKQEIETPTVMPEEKPKPQKEEKPNPKEEKPDDKPATVKKTVIRVNRNTTSLNTGLAVSVIDALRYKMTRCWVIDTTRSDVSGIRAVAHLTMRTNGTVADVWFEGASRAESDAGFAYVLDTIRAAINACQPLDMLPRSEYKTWREIQLTFYPAQGTVM
ncbi:MAG: hypothetical protein J6Y07_02990 [Alphaproteobacteria bacterium]|nr:hypothetical protein [Alphaproteobacteria bacterium]